MSTKAIAGTAYIKVDDKQYVLGGSLTLSLNTITREGLSGLSGVAGFKETHKIPYIEAEFLTTPEFSFEVIKEIKKANITVSLANGKSYFLNDAWQSGDLEFNASEGTCTVKFEGLKAGEL